MEVVNLHGIVSGKIAVVNPLQPVSVRLSTGYQTDAAGRRTPTYGLPIQVSAQVQDLSSRDLRQLDGLNIQGSQISIYLSGSVDAVVRFSASGGDLITLQDGTVWLTTTVLERWPDWIKVSVTLQDGS